jgi:hypothetical protein
VLREKGFSGIGDPGWDVKLDGGSLSDLKSGTYVYADRPASVREVSATATLFPGESKREFTTISGHTYLSGHTYFFLAWPSDRAKTLSAMSAAGGWPVCWLRPRSHPTTAIPGLSISFLWKKRPPE